MPTETMDMGQYGSKIGRSLMGILGGEDFRTGFAHGGAQVGDMQMKQAQARHYNVKADTELQRAKYQTPEFADQLAAAMAGLVGEQPAQMAQFQTKGYWERPQDFGPETMDVTEIGMEPTQTPPAWATPERISAYQQGRAAHLMNLAGTGDTNASQMADAYAGLRKQGGIDRATVDPRFAGQFGQAQAAAAGKPLFDNAGGDMAFNQFTGQAAPLSQQEAQAIAPVLGRLFGQPHQVVGDDSGGWQIVPVSGSVGVHSDGTYAQQAGMNADYARVLGIDDTRLALLGDLAASDPKTARMVAQGLVRQAFRPVSAEKLPANVQEFRAMQGMNPAERAEYQRYISAKHPGTRVDINNVMPDKAAEFAAKKEGADLGEQFAMIENKYSALDSVREAKEILSKGIYAGTYGETKKALAKGTFGLVGDRQKAINTEEFVSYVGNIVVPRLKEFGGNDSNEELRYLRSIMGSDTSMEPEAIGRILDSAERKILRGIERLQRQRGALEGGRMPALDPGPSRSGGAQQAVKPIQAPGTNQDKQALLREARSAIAAGAPRASVIKRLKELGVDGGGI